MAAGGGGGDDPWGLFGDDDGADCCDGVVASPPPQQAAPRASRHPFFEGARFAWAKGPSDKVAAASSSSLLDLSSRAPPVVTALRSSGRTAVAGALEALAAAPMDQARATELISQTVAALAGELPLLNRCEQNLLTTR